MDEEKPVSINQVDAKGGSSGRIYELNRKFDGFVQALRDVPRDSKPFQQTDPHHFPKFKQPQQQKVLQHSSPNHNVKGGKNGKGTFCLMASDILKLAVQIRAKVTSTFLPIGWLQLIKLTA